MPVFWVLSFNSSTCIFFRSPSVFVLNVEIYLRASSHRFAIFISFSAAARFSSVSISVIFAFTLFRNSR